MDRSLAKTVRRLKPARAQNGRPLPRLWLMSDPVRLPDPTAILTGLPPGSGLILRVYGMADRQRIARAARRIARRRRLALLIAGDDALALRIRADGVHWPAWRLAGMSRRPAYPTHFIVTAAAHDARQRDRAIACGADLVFVSPVFATASHPAGATLGPRGLARLMHEAQRPIGVLGGISAQRLARLSPAPAAAAAIGALSHEARPKLRDQNDREMPNTAA